MRESEKKGGGSKGQEQRGKYNKMEKVKGSVEGGTSCGRDGGFSRFLFFPFLLVESRIKQARLETVSCRRLSSHSPLLKAVNTRGDRKAGNARQQRAESSGSTALRRSLFSLPHTVLEARWGPPVELWITLHGRDTESEPWRTRMVSAKAKAYYNREQTWRTGVD